jgi:hypothetical protein
MTTTKLCCETRKVAAEEWRGGSKGPGKVVNTNVIEEEG